MRVLPRFCLGIEMQELNMWAVCIVREGTVAIKATFESPIEAEKYRLQQFIKDNRRLRDARVRVEVRSIALEKYNLEEQEVPF